MISEIFKALLITSLAGSALATVISIFRPITKKLFGYSWHYYIWLCVVFVMLIPVRFNVNPPSAPSITTQTVQTRQEVVSKQPETTGNIVQTAPTQKPQLLQKKTKSFSLFSFIHLHSGSYLLTFSLPLYASHFRNCFINHRKNI